MRGALYDGAEPDDDMRIIPAYAGSTLWLVGLPAGDVDHPCVCGEHVKY